MADEIAKFTSFGTNDLTQTTYGISRDDSSRFLEIIGQKIIDIDPFVSLDSKGVGQLIKIAKEKSIPVNKSIKLVYAENMEETPNLLNFVIPLD